MTTQTVLNIEIDLAKIRGERHFFDCLSQEFRLPDYFQDNLQDNQQHNSQYSFDGLNDCMRDLSWFTEKYIIVSFIHFDTIKIKN
ncbi:barstar family protein [Psychrobacter sp. I-STPA10]|uniref:barstar family protein n=1 Tax=Psychrobacter sp. I-STPA10 TaxID=2585769 RepID=UPI001E4C3B2A|nr:barstar family protein [Psychrobacter sp. I-STPA10]